MIKVKVTYQDLKEVEGEKYPIQFTEHKIVECESFDLAHATGVMNGTVADEHGNRLSGFMVGEKDYFRSFEVVRVEIL